MPSTSVSSEEQPRSSDEDAQAPAAGAKKRRSSYHVRKNEMQELRKQIAVLERRLSRLSTGTSEEECELQEQEQLRSSIQLNHIRLAGAQSLLSSFTKSAWQSPFYSFIHLTADRQQRHDRLQSLHGQTIETSTRILQERTRFLDLRHDHAHTERFQLPNGDFIIARLEVTPLGREISARVVFDEAIRSLHHADMTVTDHTGIITVMEEDVISDSVRQQCMVQESADGVEVQSNMVVFSHFDELRRVGTLTANAVDKDDLHPFLDSLPRVRRDVYGSIVISECTPEQDGLAPIVSMSRWMAVRLSAPPFPLTRAQEIQLRENTPVVGDVLFKALQEKLGLR